MSNNALIVLVIVLLVFFCSGPYTGWHQRGYAPMSAMGAVLLIVLLLVVMRVF